MTVSPEQRLRRANRSFLAVLALFGTAVSMSFFDRPIALWSHRAFAGTWTFRASMFVLDQLEPIGIVGVTLLFAAAVGWSANPRIPDWIKRFVVAAACAAVAIGITELLKWACGRSSAYPLFIENHIYAFRPFSRNPLYKDFPSGTLTVVVGFVTGWRPTGPFQRGVAGLAIAICVLSLLFTNGHWVSDMIAGTLVGWGVALGILARFDRRAPVPAA